ncbi:MAG: 16S rRNA (guanine(527)-N(7))-methyltransferase RsmG [Candidatus Binataceae bacterium]
MKNPHHAASKTGHVSHVSRETKRRSGTPSVSTEHLEGIATNVCERVARWLVDTTLRPHSDFLQRIEKMAATLALWGMHTNLTADASDPAEIAFHVIDSLAPLAFAAGAYREELETALATGASALDLGSGAGFPGLVLAAAFGARFTLAETRRKRASYLQVAAHEMDLDNVAIEQRRASARSIVGGFGLVTARAFGTSTQLYEIVASALRPGGILLLYASADQELDMRLDQVLAQGVTWTYRLPHGERVATRKGVLWRKPRAGQIDL